MKTIPLTDPSLEAEIRTVNYGADREPVPALRFWCPICDDHAHYVPYESGVAQHGSFPNGQHRWGNPSGSTLEDLTLAPSYLAQSPRYDRGEGCRLHIFVRDGEMQILGDSGMKPFKE